MFSKEVTGMTGHTRRRRLLWLLAPLTAALVLAAPAAGTGTYADPTGDAGAAPDITGVTMSSDPSGQLTFTMSVASWPAGDVIGSLWIDADANPSTGAAFAGGAEYAVIADLANRQYGLVHWTGSDLDFVDTQTAKVGFDTTRLRISINKSELGGTGDFNFWAGTLLGDDSDEAPNDGLWNFSFAAGGPDIRQVVVTTAPTAGPKAGRPFTVTPTGLQLPPSGAGNATPPAPESYTCKARLGAKALAGSGTGGCTFSIPKKAKRKQLSVALTVSYQGVSKTVQLAYKVR